MDQLTSSHPPESRSSAQVIANLRAKLHAAQARLDTERTQTTAFLNSLGEGLIVIDRSGVITKVNPYVTQALGYSASELVGHWFPGTIVAVNQVGRVLPHLQRPALRALLEGQAVSEASYYRHRDGRIVPVFMTVSPIVIRGQPSGAVEVFRDITPEKALDIAKDEFVSLASHQLKTPATGVKSILSMIVAGDFGPLNQIQTKFLTKALNSNEEQLQIIEDLLNVAKIDAGGIRLELEATDLAELTRSVVANHLPMVRARNQTLTISLPQASSTRLDSRKIRMVIDNLLSNASKYTPQGGHISIKLSSRSSKLELAITDTGVGIDPDKADKLFTKFGRLDNELSDSVGGTGLGLYLARGITVLHGGAIEVESEAGRGSTFKVILPRVMVV